MTLVKNKKSQLVNSSLDILKGDWDEKKCIQGDPNNCGVCALLTMFKRAKGYEDSVGKISPEDLQKKRVHLFCFVSRLFGILITENKWKYEWRNNNSKHNEKD